MSRTFKSSEKILFALCGGVVLLVGVWFLSDIYTGRLKLAQEKIENLNPRFKAAVAAASDAPFWKERQQWLDATMPVMKDSGQAHSTLLEELQSSAAERGLRLSQPVLLKPEATPHFRELGINFQITGPDSALFRWLADLQSPEKFQVIKYMTLAPASVTPPRMTGTLTLARLFQP